jgi:hypothetical protein
MAKTQSRSPAQGGRVDNPGPRPAPPSTAQTPKAVPKSAGAGTLRPAP